MKIKSVNIRSTLIKNLSNLSSQQLLITINQVGVLILKNEKKKPKFWLLFCTKHLTLHNDSIKVQ